MWIGIDIGTSAVKAVLLDRQQQVLASAQQALQIHYPQPQACEQDPEQWWAAVAAALDQLAAQCPERMPAVGAIGLSGQMHSLVLLDRHDRPVRPAMLWNDGRAAAEAAALAQAEPALQLTLGVMPMPGFTGPKLRWLQAHEPAAVARTHSLLLAKDYVRLQLSGEKFSDVSDAAGTWLFDQARRRWCPSALAACGVDAAWLPPVVESSEPCARLRPVWASRWGLSPGLPIVGGAGDVAAGGIGIGAVAPGDGFISLGTSAQVFSAAATHQPDPGRGVHAFCHALPLHWYRMAALLNGASPLAALAQWTGAGADVAVLLAEAEAAAGTGPSRLLALPFLFGERTPHNNPLARAALVGLSGATTRADVTLAVCESIAFSLADGLQALHPAGDTPAALALIGGGARSDFLGQLIATVLNVRLVRHRTADRGPAFGAARLAGLGLQDEDPARLLAAPPVQSLFEPDAALHAAYQERLYAYRALVRALEPIWPAVA